MKVTKKLHICCFKDSRWDRVVYKVDTFYRFGRIGIIRKRLIYE